MRPYLMAIAVSIVAYILLSMGLGSLHHFLYTALPEEGMAASISSLALLVLAFLPALIAGYIAGRLVKARGIAFGAVSLGLGVAILYGPFISEWSDMSQHIVNVLIGALAGGCGELHAKPKAA